MIRILQNSAGFLLALVLFSGISECNRDKKDERRDDTLLWLGVLSLSQNESSAGDCKNKTGFVVCIPPGFRF